MEYTSRLKVTCSNLKIVFQSRSDVEKIQVYVLFQFYVSVNEELYVVGKSKCV